MGMKTKLIGFILIIIGALPFLLKNEKLAESLNQYTLVTYLVPGGIVYQILLIILGILLIWTVRPRIIPTHP